MKNVLFTFVLAVALPAAMSSSVFAAQQKEQVRHVVVFKYKPGATPEQIKQIGVNNSPEGKNQGFTHVYSLTFESARARDAYLPHPEHKKFGELLGRISILEDAFVVDYKPER